MAKSNPKKFFEDDDKAFTFEGEEEETAFQISVDDLEELTEEDKKDAKS